MAYKPQLQDIHEVEQAPGGFIPSLSDITEQQQAAPQGTGFLGGLEALGLGAVRGAGDVGLGALHALQHGITPSPQQQSELTAMLGKGPRAPTIDPTLVDRAISSKRFPALGQHPAAAGLGEFAGEVAPLLIPGVGIGEAEEAAPTLLRRAGSLIGRRGIEGTALGPVYQPKEKAARSGLTGAASNIMLSLLMEAPYGAAFKKMVGGIGKKGEITPEEFKAAREIAPKGIKVPIGDVAQSPALQSAYTKISSILGSGANKPYNELALDMAKQKAGLIQDVPSNISDPNVFAYEDKKQNYLDAKANTKEAYDQLGEAGKNSQAPIHREALDNNINKTLDSFKDKMINKSSKELYGPLVNVLEDYKNTRLDNFKTATDQMPVLNDLLSSASSKNDRPMMHTLMSIKEGLDKSISDSSVGQPDLSRLYQGAKASRTLQGTFEKLNKKTRTPFYNTYLKNGDPSKFISQYIKSSPGTQENSALMRSLYSHLSPEAQHVVTSHHMDSKNMPEIIKKLNNLSPQQREIMFKDKSHLAEKMIKTAKQFPQLKSAGFEPKTGFTGAKGIQLASALTAAIMEGTHGHMGTAASIMAVMPAFGQVSQRVLRSDTLKNAYLKALEGKKAAKSPIAAAIRRGLIPSASAGLSDLFQQQGNAPAG